MNIIKDKWFWVCAIVFILGVIGLVVKANTNITAKALTDHECNADEWHFVINQVDNEEDAPASIHVVWNDTSEDVPLDKFTGGVAHYLTTDHLDLVISEATAEIYGDWSGQFNLSHGPCGETYPTPVYATPEYQTPEYQTPEYSTPNYPTPEYATPEYSTPNSYEYQTPEYATPSYQTPHHHSYHTPYATPTANLYLYEYQTPNPVIVDTELPRTGISFGPLNGFLIWLLSLK